MEKMELKLTSVARASLEELRLDYKEVGFTERLYRKRTAARARKQKRDRP